MDRELTKEEKGLLRQISRALSGTGTGNFVTPARKSNFFHFYRKEFVGKNGNKRNVLTFVESDLKVLVEKVKVFMDITEERWIQMAGPTYRQRSIMNNADWFAARCEAPTP